MRKLIWANLIAFIAAVGMGGAALWYAGAAAQSARDDANRAIRENEKTNCIAWNFIHAQQESTEPTTQAAKDFREAVDQIRKRFKCEEKD